MALRKDPILKTLPPLEDYASQLDFSKITEAIVGPPTESGRQYLADYDYADVKKMVWAAAEKWLVGDILDLQVAGIEQEYIAGVAAIPGQLFKGIIDLRGTLNGRLNSTKHYAGRRVVIDWKSTGSALDKVWDERLLDSWQWKKYLYFDNADVMIYRGIHRDGSTRELIIERPPGLEASVIDHLRGITVARNALITAGLDVWPRNMPQSCGSFGRDCPYREDCRDFTMPRGLVSIEKSISYSGMSKFLLCPERYRRSVLEDGQEGTEESNIGVAFHRGAAELYTQVRDLFIKT